MITIYINGKEIKDEMMPDKSEQNEETLYVGKTDTREQILK